MFVVLVSEINDLIVPAENADEQSEDDSVASEEENDVVGDGENGENDDDDDDIQCDAEQQNGQHYDSGTQTQEEDDTDANADQGQDDDDPMTAADNRENVAGAQSDKENVQPPQNAVAEPSSSSSTSTTVPLQPAPVAHPLVNSSNANRVKKCFKCVETFVQESVFIDHLKRYHGIVVNKPNGENENEIENENEPGQFVRNPAKKRKSNTHVADIASDENANNRKAGRKNKIKKTQPAPENWIQFGLRCQSSCRCIFFSSLVSFHLLHIFQFNQN